MEGALLVRTRPKLEIEGSARFLVRNPLVMKNPVWPVGAQKPGNLSVGIH